MASDLQAGAFSRLDEVFKFRKTLTSESDRGCGLMAAEYLDSQLKELFTAYFLDDPLLRALTPSPPRFARTSCICREPPKRSGSGL